MKNSVFGMPILLLLGMLSFHQPAMAEVSEISQSTFNKDVLASNKPVVVDFFATWCGPCRMMEPVMNGLSKDYNGKASFLRVDVDKNPELAEHFKIEGIPAILIFKGGRVVDGSVGLVPQAQLGKQIQSVLAK